MGAVSSRFQDILEEIDETLNELVEDVICPDDFILNPKNTDRTTFLNQFKPCGHYQKQCEHKFVEWFGDQWKNYPPLEPNIDYPGTGEDDLDHYPGVYIVQFDTGLDGVTYEAYQDMGDMSLIDDINKGTWLSPFADGFTTNVMPLGETCVETFARFPDDWGGVPGQDNDYDCMGVCGGGCFGVGAGYDCMKHDVCSYFKSYALEIKAEGGCRDLDCGDEATQALVNCYIKKQAGKDEAVTCSEDNEEDPNFYSTLNGIGRLGRQKRACTLHTKWERNQGMPWARGPDGSFCSSPDDCVSGRCDVPSAFKKATCQAQLANKKRCNEHSDCKSQKCGGKNPFNRKCQPK